MAASLPAAAAILRGVRAFAHDVYTYPLPAGHRFPLPKYRLVREGAEAEPSIDVRPAPEATWEELGRTHTPEYLERMRSGNVERRAQLALGLPWSPELVARARRAVGATIAAAREALDDGRVAANLGGGTHHAFPDEGRGFCVFNDVVTALRALRAERGDIRRFLVVDLDVHQGDGTHACLRDDPDAFTFSINGFRNYPFHRVPGDLELDLPDGATDERYLGDLARLLPEAIERSQPQLAFVLAGADPYAGDRLGRLALTKDGLAARDRFVRDTLAAASIPACLTLAGGYSDPIEHTVEINLTTLRLFSGAA
jgi:acetoin utilization deacetylase AcuC-like enzyme